MALKDIKNKITATNRTHKVTRAMEAVSAVKMRKTQAQALAGRPYARAALSILARLAGTDELARHPLSQERGGKKLALIVITSDKGLAGALNSGVLKRATEALAERAADAVTVFAYGKKGAEYFGRRGYRMACAIENKGDDIALSAMEELARDVARGFLAGEFDQAVAVYSNFISTFEQAPVARVLLPLSLPALTESVAGIVPAKGKWSREPALSSPVSYEFEPEGPAMLDFLVPRLVAVALYHMLAEAKASEHSARMVAMKNASDKSEEVAESLTRYANKLRQAAITREVSEIVGGREALAT